MSKTKRKKHQTKKLHREPFNVKNKNIVRAKRTWGGPWGPEPPPHPFPSTSPKNAVFLKNIDSVRGPWFRKNRGYPLLLVCNGVTHRTSEKFRPFGQEPFDLFFVCISSNHGFRRHFAFLLSVPSFTEDFGLFRLLFASNLAFRSWSPFFSLSFRTLGLQDFKTLGLLWL